MIALFYGANMIITLFNVTDSKDTLNKTLVNGFDIEVKLKGDFNIINPDVVLLLELADVHSYNYLSIPEFGRFYFVDSVTNLNRHMYRFVCSCDVLQTYKDQVLTAVCDYSVDIKPGDYTVFEGNSNYSKETTHYSDTTIDTTPSVVVSTIEAVQ